MRTDPKLGRWALDDFSWLSPVSSVQLLACPRDPSVHRSSQMCVLSFLVIFRSDMFWGTHNDVFDLNPNNYEEQRRSTLWARLSQRPRGFPSRSPGPPRYSVVTALSSGASSVSSSGRRQEVRCPHAPHAPLAPLARGGGYHLRVLQRAGCRVSTGGRRLLAGMGERNLVC